MKQFRWVGAFLALACSLTRGPAQSLGWLGAASVILGAAIHIVDSSISGFGLTVLAHAWRALPPRNSHACSTTLICCFGSSAARGTVDGGDEVRRWSMTDHQQSLGTAVPHAN